MNAPHRCIAGATNRPRDERVGQGGHQHRLHVDSLVAQSLGRLERHPSQQPSHPRCEVRHRGVRSQQWAPPHPRVQSFREILSGFFPSKPYKPLSCQFRSEFLSTFPLLSPV